MKTELKPLLLLIFLMQGIALGAETSNAVAPASTVSTTPDATHFPVQEFTQNCRTAEWLVVYDRIAWLTSDAVAKEDKKKASELGREWFIYATDKVIHAVYGRYEKEEDLYRTIFHYELVNNQAVHSKREVDKALALSFGRALSNAERELATVIKKCPVSLNKYIRQLPGGQLDVWYLPGSEPNNILVYGGEFNFQYDPQGSKLLKKNILYREFRGVRPNKTQTIDIGDGTFDLPSVGQIFFALLFKHEFDKIYIWSKGHISSYMHVGDDWMWLHTVRADPESRKRQQKGSSKQPKPTR